jgi:hypothetical protein
MPYWVGWFENLYRHFATPHVWYTNNSNIWQFGSESGEVLPRLSALTYSVGGAAAVSVPGFASGTFTYNVELPFATADGTAVAITGTPASNVTVDTSRSNLTGTITDGEATLYAMAESADGSQLYTVNFAVVEPSSDAALATLGYSIAGGRTGTIPLVGAQTSGSNVTVNYRLPYGTADDAEITL